MDISSIPTANAPVSQPIVPSGGQGGQVPTAAPQAAPQPPAVPSTPPSTASTAAQPAPQQVSASQADQVQKAVAKLNKQLEEQAAGVTLSAGLDTSGEHPGQVLVELSDKQTKQTFYKYYLPPQNVIQAADQGGAAQPGTLLSTKA